MKILGLDTTRKAGVVYIFDSENNIKYTLKMGEGIKHSEGVFLFIEKALFDCKLSIKDVDAFCGVVGPGSFTGIRVGMSVLKGFNKVVNKKLMPLTTFDIISSKYKKGLILLNSTTTSCYYAKVKSGEIVDAGVVLKSEISDFAKDEKVIYLSEEQKDMCFEYKNIEVVEDIEDLFFDCLKGKLDDADCGEFLPYYLQLSQAERGNSK